MKIRALTGSGLTAKSLIGAELVITVLSGVFAVVNHVMHGPAGVTAIFTVLAALSVISAAAMASVLWLFNLPVQHDF